MAKKKPELPKALFVGPYWYRVSLTEDFDTANDGECSPSNLQIRVRSSLPLERAAETLFHEGLHAIWDLAALGDKYEEEEIISRLSPLLFHMLKQNPTLRDLFE
jgi:hypothetical protein